MRPYLLSPQLNTQYRIFNYQFSILNWASLILSAVFIVNCLSKKQFSLFLQFSSCVNMSKISITYIKQFREYKKQGKNHVFLLLLLNYIYYSFVILVSPERRCCLIYPAHGRDTSGTPFGILQKGGVPAAPSGTATLLRLSPNHQFHLRPPLAVTDFRCPRLSWLDGRCVQGPGTYSPRHG